MHAISPSAFLTEGGLETEARAADSMTGTAALFLAGQAATRAMLPPNLRYAASPSSSPFAAIPGPGHAEYFSEPLIVSGQAGADSGREDGPAPSSLEKATSEGGKTEPRKRWVRVCPFFVQCNPCHSV